MTSRRVPSNLQAATTVNYRALEKRGVGRPGGSKAPPSDVKASRQALIPSSSNKTPQRQSAIRSETEHRDGSPAYHDARPKTRSSNKPHRVADPPESSKMAQQQAQEIIEVDSEVEVGSAALYEQAAPPRTADRKGKGRAVASPFNKGSESRPAAKGRSVSPQKRTFTFTANPARALDISKSSSQESEEIEAVRDPIVSSDQPDWEDDPKYVSGSGPPRQNAYNGKKNGVSARKRTQSPVKPPDNRPPSVSLIPAGDACFWV